MDSRQQLIRQTVRDVPDFPKPGILFKDITPVLAHREAFKATIELLVERYEGAGLTQVLAIESRGFIFGAPLALELGIGLQIARKPGKLPSAVDEVSYALEYGEATLQVHKGQLGSGRTLIIDDLLATGGTAAAAIELVAKQGAEVAECAFIIELEALGGRGKLSAPTHSLLKY
ncbi:MAG: adenine phosphoribosyltransferase [Myxococcales bacterium]|nr:adenine phosphoribosyltransferase [Myxococcales bacterium]